MRAQQPVSWPDGEALEVAARYVARIRDARSLAERGRAVACRRGSRALTEVLRSVPVVNAPFSRTPAGDELRNWFGPTRRLPSDRLPVAVLPLPGSCADYLRGRPKQALRTNLTRAAEAGLVCDDAPSAHEVWRSALLVAADRGQRVEDVVLRRPRPGLVRRFTIAYDVAGDPVGLSETIVDGDWAGLAVLLSAPNHAAAQLVRYAVHAHTVAGLIDDGVSTLAVGGSMLLTSPGTRYFQRRTGFVPVWLRPTPRVTAGTRHRPPWSGQPLTLHDLVAAVRAPGGHSASPVAAAEPPALVPVPSPPGAADT